MDLISHMKAMARNNAWSNARLLNACSRLSPDAFHARRVSFFPSICLTLNHILTVDWYYLDALLGEGKGNSVFEPETPYLDFADLDRAQRDTDLQLIRYCDALAPGDLDKKITLDRGDRGLLPDTVGAVLPHLFIHQIHHRGQVHAMLAGTDVPPPQLDEFFLMDDAPKRDQELQMIGLR